MAFPLVSLIAGTVLAATSSWAQFPGMGVFPGMMGNPMLGAGGLYGNQFGQQGQDTPDPNMLTCIGADTQDPTSQIRMTLKPLQTTPANPFMPGAMGFAPTGFPGFPGQGGAFIDRDQGRQWEMSGILIPSAVIQKAGSYEVGVFQGGRTFGSCQSSALGQVLPPRSAALNPFMGGMGGMPPLGFGGPFGAVNPLLGGMNPLLGGVNPLLGGGAQQNMGGRAARSVLTPQGSTIYTAILNDVSYNQLVGSSVALCEAIQGGRCIGVIPYCCSVVKDALPADRVYVDPNAAAVAGVGGMGGLGAAAFPATGVMGTGLAGAGTLAGAGVAGAPLGGTTFIGDNGGSLL